MSGIYISNAQMPQQGDDLIIFDNGSVWTTMRPSRGLFRIDGATAIPVPDHGRLIDADMYEYPGDLNDEPTIIPADHFGEATELVDSGFEDPQHCQGCPYDPCTLTTCGLCYKAKTEEEP